ncbi:hypothetical protein T09_5145 [Trichinella sp. T9]|nr:hypothetical protein T09_5145 [Trichinella sp. T9]
MYRLCPGYVGCQQSNVTICRKRRDEFLGPVSFARWLYIAFLTCLNTGYWPAVDGSTDAAATSSS